MNPAPVPQPGINGLAVARKSELLMDIDGRRLVWWLQYQSMQRGGLQSLGERIASRLPDAWLRENITRYKANGSSRLPFGFEAYLSESEKTHSVPDAMRWERWDIGRRIPQLVRSLCTNPAALIAGPGSTDLQLDLAKDHAELVWGDREPVQFSFDAPQADGDSWWSREHFGMRYLPAVLTAMFECMDADRTSLKDSIFQTEAVRTIFSTLETASRRGRMMVIEGLERRGKTYAARAWAAAHPGEARYVTLNGLGGRNSFNRAVAGALGLVLNSSRTNRELESEIEDVLQTSRLLLIIDEAHHALPGGPKVYSRPVIVDWIDTALCNHGVPVVLITTPQFGTRINRVAEQTGWNVGQFSGRVARWVKLAHDTSAVDIEGVARFLMPGLCASGIKLAVAYTTAVAKRDLAGLGDLFEEAKCVAQDRGEDAIRLEDLKRAFALLQGSDNAKAEALPAAVKRGRRNATPRLTSSSVSPGEDVNAGDLQTHFQPHAAVQQTGFRQVKPPGSDKPRLLVESGFREPVPA